MTKVQKAIKKMDECISTNKQVIANAQVLDEALLNIAISNGALAMAKETGLITGIVWAEYRNEIIQLIDEAKRKFQKSFRNPLTNPKKCDIIESH